MHDTTEPKLSTLVGLFPGNEFEGCDARVVSSEEVPPPYDRLLVHDQHMTVTLERHHGACLGLEVLAQLRAGDDYCRRLTLTAGTNGRVVLAGIMRIRLSYCGAEVRERIISGDTPLGRILIEHDVLRRIEPQAYLCVPLSPRLVELFGVGEDGRVTYGRVARIICDGEPAVELLEVVAPEDT